MDLQIQDKDVVYYLDKFKIKNGKIRKTYAFIETLANRMSKHNLFLVSAGIAFNIILYVIPMLLVIVFVVSNIYDVNELTAFISKVLHDFMPPSEQSSQLINMLVGEVTGVFNKGAAAGIVGILILLWLSSVLLGSIRAGLNDIFRLAYVKNYFVYKLKDIILTVMVLFLVLIMLYVIPMSNFIVNALMAFIPEVIEQYVSSLLLLGISLGVSYVNFYLLFRFVPNDKVKRRVRFWATIFSVVFIEISRNIFAWYISQSTSYSKFYGTFAIIASMCVWVYYLTTILLLSAELSQLIEDVRDPDYVEPPVAH